MEHDFLFLRLKELVSTCFQNTNKSPNTPMNMSLLNAQPINKLHLLTREIASTRLFFNFTIVVICVYIGTQMVF
jgi:hypothetical protein